MKAEAVVTSFGDIPQIVIGCFVIVGGTATLLHEVL